jgi:hypothetical protein
LRSAAGACDDVQGVGTCSTSASLRTVH